MPSTLNAWDSMTQAQKVQTVCAALSVAPPDNPDKVRLRIIRFSDGEKRYPEPSKALDAYLAGLQKANPSLIVTRLAPLIAIVFIPTV